MNLLLFWSVWMLGVVVVSSSHAENNSIGEETTTAAAITATEQQQRRENSMNMDQADETTVSTMPHYTIVTNMSSTVTTTEQAEDLPPCGCTQTLTRVVCSASTMSYETYIFMRLSSLASVPVSSLSSEMITLLQDNLVNAYNELQNLHHCDRPYHRTMTTAQLLTPNSASGNTTSLDELYLNFKVMMQSHLDNNGNGPIPEIALDASPTNTTRRLQQQHDEKGEETTSSSSSNLPPLIRFLRQLQPDVGGECTCPTAMATNIDDVGFTSEVELQQEYNERLLMLFGPESGSGDNPNNSIDEVLQVEELKDPVGGGQCSPRPRSGIQQQASTSSQPITVATKSVVTPMQSGSNTDNSNSMLENVVTPLQTITDSNNSSMFETVLIMHIELEPGWQYNEYAPTMEQAAKVNELVQMQMQLLQDSYNDEAFRNCDSYFRRIINTIPIMVDDTNTNSTVRRNRQLQLQQTLLTLLQGDDGDDVVVLDIHDDASLLTMMRNHSLSSSSVDTSKQQQQHESTSSLSSSSRLLFQPIHNSNTAATTNMAMLAVRTTVECLNGNCPADKKALAPNDVTASAAATLEQNEIVTTTNGLRGSMATITTTFSSTPTKSRTDDITATAAAAQHPDGPQQRHLLWSDIMGGCYCPSHLEGTGTAPTNVSLTDAMNRNMQLLDQEDESSPSAWVEQVTAIYEVEIHDCPEERDEFETVVSAVMVGDANLVTSSELKALGDGFESTYNTLTFQTCDPLYRTIDAVQVFIPPSEDPARRRQRLLLKRGINYNVTTDNEQEERMLQTTTKKPFVSAYAVKGKCVGICPKSDTLFTGGFGTRQRERRDATGAAAGSKRVPTEQELRSWIESSPASLTYSAFQRGLQMQEADQCACATGSRADEAYTGPTVELFNEAYSLKVEELKAQGEVINVDTVEIVEETLLCKCNTPVATSCAIPINVTSIDGVILVDSDEYPCNLDCDEFDEIFGVSDERRRRRRRLQRQLHNLTEGCDHGIFVCPL